jgi:hypothetical protein
MLIFTSKTRALPIAGAQWNAFLVYARNLTNAVKGVQVKSSQVKSSQVKSSQVKSSQVKSNFQMLAPVD